MDKIFIDAVDKNVSSMVVYAKPEHGRSLYIDEDYTNRAYPEDVEDAFTKNLLIIKVGDDLFKPVKMSGNLFTVLKLDGSVVTFIEYKAKGDE